MCYGQPAVAVWDHHSGLLQHLQLKSHKDFLSAINTI